LLLVQIDRDELKTHGCPGLQVAQQRQQRVAIFAAAETNHDPVAIGDHGKVCDGFADALQEFGFELL